jgi:hypothetical protein
VTGTCNVDQIYCVNYSRFNAGTFNVIDFGSIIDVYNTTIIATGTVTCGIYSGSDVTATAGVNISGSGGTVNITTSLTNASGFNISGGTYSIGLSFEASGVVSGGTFGAQSVANYATISGGTFTTDVIENSTGATINGGTFTVTDDNEYLTNYGTIGGGTFTASYAQNYSVINGGVFIINGNQNSTFENYETAVINGGVFLTKTFYNYSPV